MDYLIKQIMPNGQIANINIAAVEKIVEPKDSVFVELHHSDEVATMFLKSLVMSIHPQSLVQPVTKIINPNDSHQSA